MCVPPARIPCLGGRVEIPRGGRWTTDRTFRSFDWVAVDFETDSRVITDKAGVPSHEHLRADQMEVAPYDLGLPDRQTESPLPDGVEAASDVSSIADPSEPITAVEVVRYLFLAKELRRQGQPLAADRWQAKAMAWLERFSTPTDG